MQERQKNGVSLARVRFGLFVSNKDSMDADMIKKSDYRF